MKTLCLIYLLLLSYLPHIVSQQIDLEADFKKLDDAILKKDSYINKKQQEIDVIKKTLQPLLLMTNMYTSSVCLINT